MNILQIPCTKIEIIFISIIIIGSVTIFVYYLNENVEINYYDELVYLYLSNNISENGLLGHGDSLRTYLYPTIISFFHLFSGDTYHFDNVTNVIVGSSVNTKFLISIFQYATYLGTIVFITNSLVSRIKNKLVWYSIISFGFLNPYLIQASTLFLTDILSACFVTLSIIHLLNSDLSKTKNISFVMIFFFSSLMIRPSSVIFLPVIITIIFFRFIKYRDFNIIKLVLISVIIAILIIFPQLYNNVIIFGHWTPLISSDLYAKQTSLATTYLKYGTTVLPPTSIAKLFFFNPFQVPTSMSMFQLLITNPSTFSFLFIVHIFGVIDWGYVDTYIKNLYPVSRILGSILLYTTWFFIICAIISFFRNKISYSRDKTVFYFLFASSVLYLVFIATTTVESRFGYPIFLLLISFSGYGIQTCSQIMKRGQEKTQVLYKVVYFLIFLSFIIIFFYLSFLLDYQTHRIDWFTFFESQLKG